MKNKLLTIQLIRAAAFILIFLSHAELTSTGPIGVSLFLVMSGFCMTYAYLDRPEKLPEAGISNNFRFAVSKIKKLYPLHAVTLLFVALIIFAKLFLKKAAAAEIGENAGYFAANALLLQSWIPWRDGYFSFNAVAWYLSTTAFSYFIFPSVFRVIQSKQKNKMIILTVVTLAAMLLIAVLMGIGKQLWGWDDGFLKWVTYISPFYRAGDFIIGLVIGYLFTTIPSEEKCSVWFSIFEVLLILVMVFQVILYGKHILPVNWSLSLFWLPISVLFILVFALNRGFLSQLLTKSRLLVWIGDVSGDAFLIHQITIKAVEAVLKQKVLVAVTAFVLTLLLTILWRFLYSKISERIKAAKLKKTAQNQT